VNSLFPHVLEEVSKTIGCKVIHITTDCVFSGLRGFYSETDDHDCVDEYGKTKSLGENKNLMVIRTSIIGEELKNKKSLIEWVKSQNNSKVNGFTNHFWNGVTCLELAKFVENIISTESYWAGVRHIFSPEIVSKFDLLRIIKKTYNLNIDITPSTANFCDRSLTSIYDPKISKSLEQQVQEQFNFSIK
jgi:dTDP-4-dehydrorhamnose reductase